MQELIKGVEALAARALASCCMPCPCRGSCLPQQDLPYAGSGRRFTPAVQNKALRLSLQIMSAITRTSARNRGTNLASPRPLCSRAAATLPADGMISDPSPKQCSLLCLTVSDTFPLLLFFFYVSVLCRDWLGCELFTCHMGSLCCFSPWCHFCHQLARRTPSRSSAGCSSNASGERSCTRR